MKYEIKIWKDPTTLPDFKPEKAANLLQSTANAITKSIGLGKGVSNPDILIDQNEGGEDAIQSVAISYLTKEIDSVEHENVRTKKKVRVIKIDIKGNLYLPLDGGILGDAEKALGLSQGDENKLRDTLLLSKWASVLPEDDRDDHYYRGIVINIITKAGDFRLITAKKVYVDSYTENYQEGECGTFTMSLIEKVDSNDDFKVDGLGYEKVSVVKTLEQKLDKASKVVATTGAVIAGVGAVGKTVTETVEKFTGETAATRWLKYGFDTAGSAGNVANSASKIVKNPKDVKNWTDGITDINKNVNERIQKGVDTKEEIPLATMEALYLGKIKSDPERYKKYIHMSDAEKRAELEKASEEIRASAKTTKDMEKAVTYEKEVANLEKEYLDLIKADPELSEKYNKATMEEKLKMLQEQKKNFDDMQDKYLPFIKADPQKFEEYTKATTDKQLEMLEETKKQQKEVANLEKEYLDLIKADPELSEKYNKATMEEKLKMLEEAKTVDEEKTKKFFNENINNYLKDDDKIENENESESVENKPKSTSTSQINLTDKINSAAQKKNGDGNGNGTK